MYFFIPYIEIKKNIKEQLYNLLFDEIGTKFGTGDDSSLRGWAQRLYAPGQPLRLVVMRAKENAALKLGLFANRTALDGKATLYLCRGKTCQAPVNDPAQL